MKVFITFEENNRFIHCRILHVTYSGLAVRLPPKVWRENSKGLEPKFSSDTRVVSRGHYGFERWIEEYVNKMYAPPYLN